MIRHNNQAVLAWIIAYKRANDGLSPSLAQIMAGCRISSSSVTDNILRRLQQDGRIKYNGARSIQIVGATWLPPEDITQ